MKQILLRVDDALHARLTEQARQSGRSVNALANEVLAVAVNPANLSRRDRLVLRLVAVGQLGRTRSRPAPATVSPITVEQLAALRERALESMLGAGPSAVELIDYQRGPR